MFYNRENEEQAEQNRGFGNNSDVESSTWNVVKATHQYRRLLRKGRQLEPDEMQDLQWSMDVLTKHAEDYKPITSNLKDIVQGLSVIPEDVVNAVTGPLRGRFFEDTVPLAASTVSGHLGWKAGEHVMDGIVKGLGMIPGPIGATAKAFQASKYLYKGTKLAVKGAISTYAALTTNDILKDNFDAEHLRTAGVEAPERTVGEIMQQNLEHLPRNTVAAMSMMLGFGYVGKKSLARSKYNSMVDEKNAENMNKKTTTKAQEGQESATKTFYGDGFTMDDIITEPYRTRAKTKGMSIYDEDVASESAARSLAEGETATTKESSNARILGEDVKSYEPTADEIAAYERAAPEEAAVAEDAITQEPVTADSIIEEGVSPEILNQGEQPLGEEQMEGQRATQTQTEQPAPPRTKPTAGDFYNLVKSTASDLSSRKRVSVLDVIETFKVDKDLATGKIAYDPNRPINSEARLALFYTEVQKAMLDTMTEPQKHQYMFSLFHKSGDVGASNSRRFVDYGLFSNLRRNGVKDVNKEIGFLRGNIDAQAEMIKYYRGETNKASPIAKVMAENIQRTYKDIKNKLSQLGVVVQDLDYGYLPQRASVAKITKNNGRTSFTQDLAGWIDLKKMGLEESAPAEINKVMDTIYNTFLRLDNFGDLSFTGEGGSTLGKLKDKRVIHFKDAKSYIQYMDKYGAFENPLDAVLSNVRSMANLLGMFEQFGPDPEKTAATLLTHIKNPLEGMGAEANKKLGFVQLNKLKGEALRLAVIKKFNHNMFNAFFYKGEGEGSFLLDHGWLGASLRMYNALEGIGKNLITANNAIWEIIETPLATAFLNSSYQEGGTPKKVLDNYKMSIQGLASHIGKGLDQKQGLAMQDIGIAYGIQNDLMPYSLSQGTPYDMPIGARKVNATINNIKGTDSLTKANQTTAAVKFQNMLGNQVNAQTKWEALPSRVRGLLESGGLNKADWNLLLSSDVLVKDYLFADLPIDINSNLLSGQYILKMNKDNPKLGVIAEKLMAMQQNHVQRSVSSAQFASTASILGKNAASRDMGGWLAKNSIVFRGYQFDRIARWISMLDQESHSFTKEKFVAYAWQRMAIGLTVGMIRWGLVGRTPQLDSTQDFFDLIMDGAARGDLMPLAIAKEFFADFYFTQGNNWTDTLVQKAGTSALGVGAASLAQHTYNGITGVSKMIEGDYQKAFAKMRRAFPGSGFIPIDIIFNRLLLDNIFESIDEDGFYQLAKKEMATNAKNNYKYYIEPGRFTKSKGGDVSGATGIEGLRSKAEADFREERAEYREESLQEELAQGTPKDIAKSRAKKKAAKFKPTNPLYAERAKANKAINKLNRKRLESEDPDVWDTLQAEIDQIQAQYDFKVAQYYRNNRPETITPLQAENAYKRAKRLAGA